MVNTIDRPQQVLYFRQGAVCPSGHDSCCETLMTLFRQAPRRGSAGREYERNEIRKNLTIFYHSAAAHRQGAL
jgi:hypothetical protein